MKSLAHSSFLKKYAAVQSILKVNERVFFFQISKHECKFQLAVHAQTVFNKHINLKAMFHVHS